MAKPAELLTRDRADLSQFLIHLTRNGVYERYIDLGGGRYTWENSDRIQAEDSLRGILGSCHIEARSPLGYFKFKVNTRKQDRGGVLPSWIKCVCFSETPLHELRHFYRATVRKRNEYQKFGIGFWSEGIRKLGGNPIFYADTNNSALLGSLERMIVESRAAEFKALLPLVEVFGPPLFKGRMIEEVDFRWEREWRLVGNLKFQPEHVAFGICDGARVDEFESFVKNSFPFIDPDWEVEYLKEQLSKKWYKKLLAAL